MAVSNVRKHGAALEEAVTSLLDSLALVRDDPDACGKLRLVLLGMSHTGRLLTVCYALLGVRRSG